MFSNVKEAKFFVRFCNDTKCYDYDSDLSEIVMCENSEIFFSPSICVIQGLQLNPGNIHLQMLQFEEFVQKNIYKPEFECIRRLIFERITIPFFNDHFNRIVSMYNYYYEGIRKFESDTAVKIFSESIIKTEISLIKNTVQVPEDSVLIVPEDFYPAIRNVFEVFFNVISSLNSEQEIVEYQKYFSNIILYQKNMSFERYKHEVFMRLCAVFIFKKIKKSVNIKSKKVFLSF